MLYDKDQFDNIVTTYRILEDENADHRGINIYLALSISIFSHFQG